MYYSPHQDNHSPICQLSHSLFLSHAHTHTPYIDISLLQLPMHPYTHPYTHTPTHGQFVVVVTPHVLIYHVVVPLIHPCMHPCMHPCTHAWSILCRCYPLCTHTRTSLFPSPFGRQSCNGLKAPQPSGGALLRVVEGSIQFN